MASDEETNSLQILAKEKFMNYSDSDKETDDSYEESIFNLNPYYLSSNESNLSETDGDTIINDISESYDMDPKDNEVIEVLEENNNDPNNNTSDENNETVVTCIEERSVSPQPGCSKEFDILENSSNHTDINHLAGQILNLISKITHQSIVAALNKAQIEGNKRQIKLSDLLPCPKVALKRPHSDCVSHIESKKFNSELHGIINRVHNISQPLESSTSGSSFISKVFVDLKDTNSHPIANSSESLRNSISEPTNNIQLLPAVHRQQFNPHSKTSTTSSQIADISYPHAIPNLLDSESPQRDVCINDYTMANEKSSKRLDLKQCKKTNTFNTATNPGCSKHDTIISAPSNSFLDNSNSNKSEPTSFQTTLSKFKELEQRIKTATNDYEDINDNNTDDPIKNAKQMLKGFRQSQESSRSATSRIVHVPRQIADHPQAKIISNVKCVVHQQSPPHSSQSHESVENLEILYKLRAIFPNLDRNYIKQFCPTTQTPNIRPEVQLSRIVNNILMNEASWICDNTKNNIESNKDTGTTKNGLNIDEIYEYLAGIFPDADPHYLRNMASNFQNENAVKSFIDKQLKNADYPTREQYLARLKITKAQKRYTTDFVVSDFITIFPDPFKYFEDENRKCEFNLDGLEFLKFMYNRVRVATINKIYQKYNYNISLAAKHLEYIGRELMNRRCSRLLPTNKIPMLQEMAFIRHRDEITQYIDQIKANEAIEFQLLKSQGSLLECQCCYDTECMPSKCSTCENGHNFCNSCVIAGTNSKLGDGETHISCFLLCGREFSLSTLQKILLPTTFSIILKKRQEAEVMAAGLEGLVSCPFCHFASIPPENDKVFKCLNPECMKQSCRSCREPNHLPLRCNEVEKSQKARIYIEEKMTQALARTCDKCKRVFFKEEGCNKIQCPCGAITCYLCNKPIKDYSHFAGQGSNNKDKCPLWSDNKRLNAKIVTKVAEDARNELLRQDPTLTVNMDKLAPEIPAPTAGPHEQIHVAEDLTVQRAAQFFNSISRE